MEYIHNDPEEVERLLLLSSRLKQTGSYDADNIASAKSLEVGEAKYMKLSLIY